MKTRCFSIKEDINFNNTKIQNIFERRSSKFIKHITFFRHIRFLDNSGITYPFSSVNFADIHLIFRNNFSPQHITFYNPLEKELNEKKVSSFR